MVDTMSVKKTLPVADASSNLLHAAIRELTYALQEDCWPEGTEMLASEHVEYALAGVRKHRAGLPVQGGRVPDYDEHFPQDELLASAVRNLVGAVVSKREPSRYLRYAEAAMRTWLKREGQK